MDVLIDPLEFPFMQRAFLAAGFAAVVCALVGTFVVLKGLAFMGDAVAHSFQQLDHVLTRIAAGDPGPEPCQAQD
ncbi:MAG: metal ABC transporter permease [Proteobacteria bacterium]|nr:metal ABC transporter permease [Pseudomonadota bacterium]